MKDEPIVYVVDDDPAARDSLAALLSSKDVAYETYASAEQFLEGLDRSRGGCLVLDVRMDGMSGLELQKKLQADGVQLPTIVITGYGDVPTAVSAMRTGAIAFLEKPCCDLELWKSISSALGRHRTDQQDAARRAELRARLARLTPLEHQVMRRLIAGMPNKVIAAEIHIGLRTVELRRSRVMRKMEAESLAELVRLCLEAEVVTEGAA